MQSTPSTPWWRQPVVWLLCALLAAAAAASVWTVMLAGRDADQALAGTSTMPGIGVARHAASAAASNAEHKN